MPRYAFIANQTKNGKLHENIEIIYVRSIKEAREVAKTKYPDYQYVKGYYQTEANQKFWCHASSWLINHARSQGVSIPLVQNYKLTEKNKNALAWLRKKGYDSAYNIMKNSGYKVTRDTASGTGAVESLEAAGLVVCVIAKNPETGRTCRLTMLPEVANYWARFGRLPNGDLLQAILNPKK